MKQSKSKFSNLMNQSRQRAIRKGFAAFLLLSISACARPAESFEITDARLTALMSTDQKQPAESTSQFPQGTEAVYCWFSWKGAKPGSKLTARWYYTSGDIHILDYSFPLTRISDKGVLSLKMPPGKFLPPGSYRLDMEIKGRVMKTIPFSVLTQGSKIDRSTPSNAPHS